MRILMLLTILFGAFSSLGCDIQKDKKIQDALSAELLKVGDVKAKEMIARYTVSGMGDRGEVLATDILVFSLSEIVQFTQHVVTLKVEYSYILTDGFWLSDQDLEGCATIHKVEAVNY